MTHHELRQLLSERVAHETPVDLTSRAWESGRRQRRRRAGVLAAGAAAAVAITAVAIPTLGDDGPRRAPTDPAAPTSDASPSIAQLTGTTVGAYAVSYAPTVAQEAQLPDFTGDRAGYPAEIDLSADAPSAETDPLPRAQLAVAVAGERGFERTLLVYGEQIRSLELPAPPTSDMLSTDGTRLTVRKGGREWRFDVTAGTWQESPAKAPTLPDASPPASLGPRAQLYGQLLGDAQAVFTDVDVPLPDGSVQTNPEAIVVTRPSGSLLVFPYEPGDDSRWKQCCPVAGWLPGGELVFESRHAAARILTWLPGTDEFTVLSHFVGWTPGEQSWITSYAQFE